MFLSLLDLAAVFLLLIAIFGWVNLRFLHLPMTVALMAIGLVSSLTVMGADMLAPQFGVHALVSGFLSRIDFTRAVLDFMLSFLLFAGGMHLDLGAARRSVWSASILATAGTVLSTIAIGFGTAWLAGLLGLQLSLGWALVFGALISPTDPAAILALMKYAPLPRDVRALIQAESLFNDGVGVVLFGALLSLTAGGGLHLPAIGEAFVVEAGAAVLLGLAASYIALRALAAIDDYTVETAITLALATGVYALANRLHVSGPIAAAVAGMAVGSEPARRTMSETTQRYVRGFWNLIDEILNATLFLLIGLEVLVVNFELRFATFSLLLIFLVLLARLVSVGIPALALRHTRERMGPGIIAVLTWTGARGGISIALALSLSDGPQKSLIVMATYMIVLFSVFVQSMTIPQLVRRVRLSP